MSIKRDGVIARALLENFVLYPKGLEQEHVSKVLSFIPKGLEHVCKIFVFYPGGIS